MDSEFISRQELYSKGWNLRSVVKGLDVADKFGPINHPLNVIGTPFYNKDRVTVAEYRIGLSTVVPSEKIWNKWKESERPTSFPISDFNFLLLAKKCNPCAYEALKYFQGIDPNLRCGLNIVEKERELIFKSFISIIEFSDGIRIRTMAELEKYLAARARVADNSELFVGESLSNIVVRAARRSKFICNYTSKVFMREFIDCVSLVHEGRIHGVQNRRFDFADLLIYGGALRFDIKSLKTQRVV